MARLKENERIACYHLDGGLFQIYLNTSHARRSLHKKGRQIEKCLRGEASTAYGYLFRRVNVDEIKESIEGIKYSNISRTSKAILEVNKEKQVLRRFPSIRSASLELHIDPHSIRDVLNKKYPHAGGHIFVYESQESIEQSKGISLSKKKRVVQYSLDGKYIKQYPSISSAAKELKKRPLLISNCINGKYKTAYGFIWKLKKK